MNIQMLSTFLIFEVCDNLVENVSRKKKSTDHFGLINRITTGWYKQ